MIRIINNRDCNFLYLNSRYNATSSSQCSFATNRRQLILPIDNGTSSADSKFAIKVLNFKIVVVYAAFNVLLLHDLLLPKVKLNSEYVYVLSTNMSTTIDIWVLLLMMPLEQIGFWYVWFENEDIFQFFINPDILLNGKSITETSASLVNKFQLIESLVLMHFTC